MKAMEIQGVVRGKKVIATNSDAAQPCPDDRVNREFVAAMPNQIRPLGYKWSGSCARLEPLPGTSFMTGSGGVRPFPSWSLWAVYEYGRPRLFY